MTNVTRRPDCFFQDLAIYNNENLFQKNTNCPKEGSQLWQVTIFFLNITKELLIFAKGAK